MTGVIAVLAGSGGPIASFSNASLIAVNPGATATALFRLANDGSIFENINGSGFAGLGDWVTPTNSVAAALFEARATVTSGTLTSGTAGSWLALSSTRDWSRNRTSVGTDICVFTLEIRRVGSATVADSATITLEAEYA